MGTLKVLDLPMIKKDNFLFHNLKELLGMTTVYGIISDYLTTYQGQDPPA